MSIGETVTAQRAPNLAAQVDPYETKATGDIAFATLAQTKAHYR
jgi:hypothetical protein